MFQSIKNHKTFLIYTSVDKKKINKQGIHIHSQWKCNLYISGGQFAIICVEIYAQEYQICNQRQQLFISLLFIIAKQNIQNFRKGELCFIHALEPYAANKIIVFKTIK